MKATAADLPEIAFPSCASENTVHLCDERARAAAGDVYARAVTSITFVSADENTTWGEILTRDHARQLRAWLDVLLDLPAGETP